MSINRPALKLRRGPILIGLLTVAATGAALVPTAAIGRGPSHHNLVFKVNGKARQNVVRAGGITITATCPAEACTVIASATSTSPSIRTGRIRARIAAGDSSRLVLPLAEKDSAKLSAALAAGKSPTFTVKATAKDAFGAQVPLRLTVRPLKP